MSTYIKKKQTYRRRRAREPMVDGDVESAEAVTHTRIAEHQDDGSVIIKHVLESLDSSTPESRDEPRHFEVTHDRENYNNEEMHNMYPPQTPRLRKCRVSVIFV